MRTEDISVRHEMDQNIQPANSGVAFEGKKKNFNYYFI